MAKRKRPKAPTKIGKKWLTLEIRVQVHSDADSNAVADHIIGILDSAISPVILDAMTPSVVDEEPYRG